MVFLLSVGIQVHALPTRVPAVLTCCWRYNGVFSRSTGSMHPEPTGRGFRRCWLRWSGLGWLQGSGRAGGRPFGR